MLYKLVSASHEKGESAANLLSNAVMVLAEEGWLPYGTPFSTTQPATHIGAKVVVFQAMILPDAITVDIEGHSMLGQRTRSH